MNDKSRYDPELEGIVDYFHRIWESAILVAAMELDLFGALHGGSRSAEEIAVARGLDAKGVRILLDALCPAGFVEKRDGRYLLTKLSSRHLDPHSESYAGPIHAGAAVPERWTALGRLADAVRKGGPVLERSVPPDERFRILVQAIKYTADYAAPLLADHLGLGRKERTGWSILDAACGAGAYGLKLLQSDPTGRLTLIDTPRVLELAEQEASKSGLMERVELLPGDLFEMELPQATYDLILLSHFLHSNPKDACADVISKLAGAQRRGGFIAVHEFIPDEERCRRRFPLLFAMNMYISNSAGDAYTFSEIKVWLEAAGYTDVELIDTPGRSSFVIGKML